MSISNIFFITLLCICLYRTQSKAGYLRNEVELSVSKYRHRLADTVDHHHNRYHGRALNEPPKERACADFNIGASRAALAGLSNTFVCPADGISRVMCSEEWPTKNVTDITPSSISFNDVVFYLFVGPRSSADAFLWWIPLMTESVDIVLVGDPCPNNAPNCGDNVDNIATNARNVAPTVHTHIIRVTEFDVGYNRLSCKLRTGAKRIFETFPNKKYYIKIDTDTIVFPRRFLNFIHTMDSVANSNNPIYFGAIVESGMNLILCGRMVWGRGDNSKGGLCYAQGGAGYGLNPIAMKALGDSPSCNASSTEDYPEDSYVAMRMWDVFRINVIHCGGFSSSELYNDAKAKNSITFHYIDARWLKRFGETLKKLHGSN